MAGVGEGAAPGDRVVDGVDTGGEIDLGEVRLAGLVGDARGLLGPAGAAETAGDLVECREHLGRFQVQQRQGAYRGAQFAHGDGGAQSSAHHVADDQGGAVAGEFDDVEPVAADLGGGVAREIAAGDVEAGGLRVAGRQQAALEDQRPLVLPAVEAGVVDTDRGARGEFDGECPVPFAEGLAALGPGELHEADDGVVRDHRHGERGLDERALLAGYRLHPGGAQGVGAGRVEGVAVHFADRGGGAVLLAAARCGIRGASETALAKATRRSSALPPP